MPVINKETTELQRRAAHREAIGIAIDAILKTPLGPERWRKAIALYLNLNPVNEDGMTAKEEYRRVVEDNKWIRETQSNKFGTNKTETMRFGLNAPPWFMQQIELFDKISFESTNPKVKTNFRKLCNEFKEFKIMEKI